MAAHSMAAHSMVAHSMAAHSPLSGVPQASLPIDTIVLLEPLQKTMDILHNAGWHSVNVPFPGSDLRPGCTSPDVGLTLMVREPLSDTFSTRRTGSHDAFVDHKISAVLKANEFYPATQRGYTTAVLEGEVWISPAVQAGVQAWAEMFVNGQMKLKAPLIHSSNDSMVVQFPPSTLVLAHGELSCLQQSIQIGRRAT